MFVRLRHGATGVVVVIEDAAGDSPFRINVDADVSPGEVMRALFESGAAVQQAGDGYLISREWLRRQGAVTVGIADGNPMSDAIHAVVTWLPTE